MTSARMLNHIPSWKADFGEGWLTIMVRRARLIDELRSGRFTKGMNYLYTSGSFARDRNFIPEAVPGRFCCIGVGGYLCNVPLHEMDTLKDAEIEADWVYGFFNDVYGIPTRVQHYLIGMNDGSSVKKDQDTYGGIYGSGALIVRKGGISREFSQIARFLEIIWGFNS